MTGVENERMSKEDKKFIHKMVRKIISEEGPKANRRTPNGRDWTITDLCVLRNWMNKNIKYQRDTVTHGVQHDLSGPTQVLRNQKEDCEDHAMLFGSMAQLIGAYCRLVIATGQDGAHAFMEVCLGHESEVSISKVEREIRDYHTYRADLLNISQNHYVCDSSGFAPGWKLNERGIPERISTNSKYFSIYWSGVSYSKTESGYIYMIADTLFGRYLGDISSFVRQGYRIEDYIDVNRSSVPTLKKLLNIDQNTAQKIVQKRPYSSIDDLKNDLSSSEIRRIKSLQKYFDPREPFWKDCSYKYPLEGEVFSIYIYNTRTLKGPHNGYDPFEAQRRIRAKFEQTNQEVEPQPSIEIRDILQILLQSNIVEIPQTPQDDKAWYFGPEREKMYLTPEEILERVKQEPRLHHYVYFTGDWIDGRWVQNEWLSVQDIAEFREIITGLTEYKDSIDNFIEQRYGKKAKTSPVQKTSQQLLLRQERRKIEDELAENNSQLEELNVLLENALDTNDDALALEIITLKMEVEESIKELETKLNRVEQDIQKITSKNVKTPIRSRDTEVELSQILRDELFDKTNNGWTLILEREYFLKKNGEWNRSKLSLVAKKLRVYDKRLKNNVLLTWVDDFYKDTEQIVFPISIKRKEIIKLYKELKQSGQFPTSGFFGWVVQRGAINKAQIK